MSGIPQLRRDEEFLAFDDGWDYLLQRSTDLVLVLVNHRQIEMAIPVPHSDFNLMPMPIRHEMLFLYDIASPDALFLPPPLKRGQDGLTAFSTSLGFDIHVPKPIWGIFELSESVR